MRLLFVCGGATCRSPLAFALASKRFPQAAVDFAGNGPGTGITPAAAATAMARGAPLGDASPKALTDIDLGSFDTVIVLDDLVAELVASQIRPPTRFIVHHVEDPYGGPAADYERAADEIEQILAALETGGEPSSMSVPGSRGDVPDIAPEVDKRSALLHRIERWQSSLAEAAPTHLQGMASTALIGFEMELKHALTGYMTASGAALEELLDAVHYKGNARTVDRQTLGVLVECLTALGRADAPFRYVYTKDVESDFRALVPLRNTVQHEVDLTLVSDVLVLVRAAFSRDRFWTHIATRH